MAAKKDLLVGEGWDGIEGNIDTPKAKTTKTEPTERRVRIVLEDNDQISPNGQFFGVNGKGYMIRPGEEVDVPESILNVLDTAVMSVPVTDGSSTVIGYRDRLRFPYRIITSRRAA
jgi:hypothetical protein